MIVRVNVVLNRTVFVDSDLLTVNKVVLGGSYFGDFEWNPMVLYGVTVQMNATEQYFPMILLIMLYKVVLTFESVDEIL